MMRCYGRAKGQNPPDRHPHPVHRSSVFFVSNLTKVKQTRRHGFVLERERAALTARDAAPNRPCWLIQRPSLHQPAGGLCAYCLAFLARLAAELLFLRTLRVASVGDDSMAHCPLTESHG